MNENQRESTTIKTTFVLQSKDKNVSTNKSIKNVIKEEIKNFQLFICLKRVFLKISMKWQFYISKCSLLTQFLLFLIPFILILYFTIFFFHYFGFERIYKFDYFYAVEKEYLKYLITDLDDIHFEICSKEIKSQYEDIENLYFFEIYFQEMISMGLLDEDPYQIIFPNISQNSEYLYKSYDEFNANNKINNIYRIPKQEAEKYIDKRKDGLSEIAKLYYLYMPLITYEYFTKKNFINETFLIAYEFNNETKEVIGEDYLYFAYPLKMDEIEAMNFFYPTNKLISPQISKTKIDHGEKFNDSFYKENWFIQQDYNYRRIADKQNFYSIKFSNLNYDYYGNLNKSNIISLQTFFHSKENNKSYIINIIYYVNQRQYKEEYLDFSSFLLFNESSNSFEIEKYSDNNTFLISKSKIVEFMISSSLKEYFHYGMYDKNYNFFKQGVSFDSLDLYNIADPLKYYNTIEEFNIDLKYFTSLYLYSSLFNRLKFNISEEETKELNSINFINYENNIQNICKNINFTSYLHYLEQSDINCFDENNLLYYAGKGDKKDAFNFNYYSMPFCVCLPLYCLKNLKKNTKINHIDKFNFMEKIILPEKCQNIFIKYYNEKNENNKTSEFKSILKFNFGLNNINIFSINLKENIENEYYIYKSMAMKLLSKTIIMIVTLVDNSSMKKLLSSLATSIDLIKTYYIMIELVGMFAAFIWGGLLVIRSILKISKVIYDYEKIHNNYLYKLESNKKEIVLNKNNKENNNFNSEKKLQKNNFSTNSALTKSDNSLNKVFNLYSIYISNDNPLLNDLGLIYMKYYKIKKEKLVKKNHELKELKKKKTTFEENELFKLLRIISFNIPKYKLNVALDYNFYENSKLNIDYLKSISKFQNNKQIILFTQSAIYELLSTEKIENCGLITNFNFKYITNINLNKKKENSSIKKSMFAFIETVKRNEEEDSNYDILIEGDEDNNNKIIWKEKNKILEEFEGGFENDDYLQKDKMSSAFDSFLINCYYKYLNKIIALNSQAQSIKVKFD